MPQEHPPVPFAHETGPLSGYRVLDFADEKGQLCARVLGELGADVIKVEPRDGDATRQNGPFFKGETAGNTSLYWWAMNAGKRSVTCELRLEPGRDLARRLAATADIVVETWKPGLAAEYGLDYDTLAAINPGVIVVSITNFGQTGPYSQLEATDIVGAAMGGSMYLNGDAERGPVRITAPQAYAQVNFQAAVGAMVALYARGVNDGLGQHVDVSMQEAVSNTMDNAQAIWDIRRVNSSGPGLRRSAASAPGAKEGATGFRYLFETADGWLAALQAGGLIGPGAGAMVDWLASEGEAMGLDSAEWRARLTSLQPLSEQERLYIEEVLSRFCKTRKKEDLVAEAQARGSGWAPVFSPSEIVDSVHLAGRDYWVRVQHDDIGESFIYPGAPFKLTETPWAQRGRAPHVGEHNEQVYAELGLDPAELKRLRMRMVV